MLRLAADYEIKAMQAEPFEIKESKNEEFGDTLNTLQPPLPSPPERTFREQAMADFKARWQSLTRLFLR